MLGGQRHAKTKPYLLNLDRKNCDGILKFVGILQLPYTNCHVDVRIGVRTRSKAFGGIRESPRRSRGIREAFARHAVTIGVRGRSAAIWSKKRRSKSPIRRNSGMS